MRCLLDASALLPVATKHGRSLLTETRDNWFAITDLAIYEACNGLWKMAHLLQQVSIEDAKEIVSVIRVLVDREMLHLLSVSELELASTFELAIRRKLTYYDASYVSAAKRTDTALVTQDAALAKAARELVEVLTVEDFEDKLS